MRDREGMRCRTCAYWDPTIADSGNCRVRPPVAEDRPLAMALWPLTSARDWCGEWTELGGKDV